MNRLSQSVALASAVALGCAAYGYTVSGFFPSPPTSSTWAISIVLAPRLVASRPGTLAVLGVDGRLAAGVTIDLSDGQSVTTDSTGRAFFTAPARDAYLLAKASGASAAALIDSGDLTPASAPLGIRLPAVISAHDQFWICGGNLRGDSDANHVTIGGQLSLVLAASPSCIVVLPGPYVQPGLQSVVLDTPGGHWTGSTTIVFLEFAVPNPPLRPGKKGHIAVRARGSAQKLALAVENRSPGVLDFSHGDAEELSTSGGDPNVSSFPVLTIRSGDYSFHARLLAEPQPEIAARYLVAAATLAPRNLKNDVSELARRLSPSPRSEKDVRSALDEMIGKTIASDFRILLEAARSSL